MTTIYHVTAGYPQTDLTAALQVSAKYEGFRSAVIPEVWPHQRLTTIDKFHLLRAFIIMHGLFDHDIIFFSDAYDVFILQSCHEIIRRFRTIGGRILFNAETNFFPNEGRDSARQAFEFASTRDSRYLNSGCFIGYVWAIREMLDWCLARAIVRNPKDHALDQELAQDYWMECQASHSSDVVLDTESRIFATLLGAEQQYVYDRSLIVAEQGHDICILHANGNKINLNIIHSLYSLLYDSSGVKRFVDLRTLRSGGKQLRYVAEHRCFELVDRPDDSAVFLLGLGSRLSIALTASHGPLTFHPAGSISFGALVMAEWEILYGIESPRTIHGHDVFSPIVSCPISLDVFSFSWMRELIRSAISIGEVALFAPGVADAFRDKTR